MNGSLTKLSSSFAVGFFAVADPEHEESFLRSGVNDARVPYVEFVQSCEFSGEGFPVVAL